MEKKQAWTWFGIIAGITIVAFILGEHYGYEWMTKSLGIVGVILSLGGVLMALVQIRQADDQIKAAAANIATVAETTARIQTAVNENREEIRDFLSIAEVAHLIESISNVQSHVRTKSYSTAIILLQTIKDNLIRASRQFQEQTLNLEVDIKDLIKNLTLDIETLAMHDMYKSKDLESKHPLKRETIHKNLEDAREVLIIIETSLKQKKL